MLLKLSRNELVGNVVNLVLEGEGMGNGVVTRLLCS